MSFIKNLKIFEEKYTKILKEQKKFGKNGKLRRKITFIRQATNCIIRHITFRAVLACYVVVGFNAAWKINLSEILARLLVNKHIHHYTHILQLARVSTVLDSPNNFDYRKNELSKLRFNRFMPPFVFILVIQFIICCCNLGDMIFLNCSWFQDRLFIWFGFILS